MLLWRGSEEVRPACGGAGPVGVGGLESGMSIFAKIVAGEIPCHRLYEDEHVLAFLDVGPVARGHCLLIPKEEFVELGEVPAEVGAALGAALPRLVRAVKRATRCAGVNVLQNNGEAAGQAVMHVHFHVIPRYEEAAAPGTQRDAPERPGFRFEWPAGKLEDDDAKELTEAIRSAMG